MHYITTSLLSHPLSLFSYHNQLAMIAEAIDKDQKETTAKESARKKVNYCIHRLIRFIKVLFRKLCKNNANYII